MTLFPDLPPDRFAKKAEKLRTTVPSTRQTLRRLFLTLFLRGRTSRGLQKGKAPRSVGEKLAGSLLLYAFFGLIFSIFLTLPIFALSIYLHAMTFGFIGLFVASSSGEVLFNKEEADILLHRPIDPQSLLWAKVFVLIEVSLWLGIAYNLAALFRGYAAPDANWLWLPAHLLSIALEAIFCVGFVVLVYELCLRWFGRERLDGLMTTAQVLMAIVAVVGSQLLPQLMLGSERIGQINRDAWWIALFPPAWFAGIDDALAGSGARNSWLLGSLAVATTACVSWLAFGRLAQAYEAGLQRVIQTAPTRVHTAARGRFLERLVDAPPLRWWLRDPVSRAAFLLTSAYLVRDRDVKLRVYPAIAPFMAMPLIFLLGPSRRGLQGANGFGIAFSGCYLCLVPMMAIGILRYSQQWQASDIFRSAPLENPVPLCHGARRAVLSLIAVPLIALYAILIAAIDRDLSHLVLLLPGIIAMPVFALAPSLDGSGVPLSSPTEEAKGASRGLAVFGFSFIAFLLAGLSTWSWSAGWFGSFVLAELVLAIGCYAAIRRRFRHMRWPATD
jgi:ABC-2 type transport system permease protein